MAYNRTKTHTKLNITLPTDLLDALKVYAAEEERAVSPLIAKAIKLYLETVKPQQ